MNFDYLYFDVDGTLWDTTEIVARSWNYTLEKLRFERQPLTASDLKQEFGKPMDIIAADLFPQLPAAKGEALLAKCCRREHRFLENAKESFLYPDVEYVFSRLSSNHKLFIVSNCQSGYIELFLKKNNLRNYITDIECYGNTKKSKGENNTAFTEPPSLRHCLLYRRYCRRLLRIQRGRSSFYFRFLWIRRCSRGSNTYLTFF